MAITKVVCVHSPGPHQNGFDGCHSRWAEHGMCPGVKVAAWLNDLGEDDAPYGSRLTNLDVRLNYIRSHNHVGAAEPVIAELLRRRQAARKELRNVGRRLKEVGYNR